MLSKSDVQQKLQLGFETMYIYIEESTDFDTVTVNVNEMWELTQNEDKLLWVDDVYCISYNGEYFEHGSTSNIVFGDEEKVINFCVEYLMDLRFSEDEIITKTEAEKEVVNNSNGSFKIV